MNKILSILIWIDTEMEFDKWYKVQSEEQKQFIQQIMDSGLIPDCEFNSDYTKFRKLKLVFEIFF